MRDFFSGVRVVYGPTPQKSAPLKGIDGSTATTEEDIRQCWRTYFSDLLNVPSTASQDALNAVPQLAAKPHLETLHELKRAIAQLKDDKSPGPDNIPAEVFKYGGDKVQSNLYQIVVEIWKSGDTQETRNSIIIPIFAEFASFSSVHTCHRHNSHEQEIGG
ncbi:hypothetical protein ACOME3_002533 [Neoechinorhynchus agilis]